MTPAEARARGLPDIVERLREWSAADMDTHASLRRNGERVAVVPWSRHGTDLAETVLDAEAEIERLRAALRRIANNSGCCEACPCWAKLRDAAAKTLPDAPA